MASTPVILRMKAQKRDQVACFENMNHEYTQYKYIVDFTHKIASASYRMG